MQEDVAILKKMGFDAYRFSISWSRVLPSKKINVSNRLKIRLKSNIFIGYKMFELEFEELLFINFGRGNP